jgi:hypothetical protein
MRTVFGVRLVGGGSRFGLSNFVADQIRNGPPAAQRSPFDRALLVVA